MRMKNYLTLQLGSYQNTDSVLDLFIFPISLISNEISQITVSGWCRGKTFKSKSNNFGKIRKTLSGRTFNEASLKITFTPHFHNKYPLKIISISCVLLISPLNSIWANVQGYTLDNRNAESMRCSYEAKELNIKWNMLNRYPTLLYINIEYESTKEESEVQRAWLELIADTCAEDLSTIVSFGCGDFSQPAFDILSEIVPFVRGCAFLDQYFDNVHTILIGNASLCKNLYDQVNHNLIFRYLGNNAQNLGIVGLVNNDHINSDMLSKYFVPKDHSTAHYNPGAKEGHYQVGKYEYTTMKRHRELKERGLLPTTRENINIPLINYKYFPLINDNYAQILGLNRENILVGFAQVSSLEKYEEAIDKHYREMKNEHSEKDLIFIAHVKAYGEVFANQDQVHELFKLLKKISGPKEPMGTPSRWIESF